MQVPPRDVEVREHFPQTAVVRFSPEGAIHVCGVGAFEEVGEVARVVAELTEEGDVGLEVMADEDDFAPVGGVGEWDGWGAQV